MLKSLSCAVIEESSGRLTPYFAAYPGSPTLRVETYRAIVRDLLDSLHDQGFRRFLFVNGHGGNDPGGDAAHVRKVEMFHKGEFEIFEKAGCHPVFFGDALMGSRLPQLTYMLSFANLAELEKGWAAFSADPDWKKLSSSPRYSYEAIVSNISNLVLSPLAASQI